MIGGCWMIRHGFWVEPNDEYSFQYAQDMPGVDLDKPQDCLPGFLPLASFCRDKWWTNLAAILNVNNSLCISTEGKNRCEQVGWLSMPAAVKVENVRVGRNLGIASTLAALSLAGFKRLNGLLQPWGALPRTVKYEEKVFLWLFTRVSMLCIGITIHIYAICYLIAQRIRLPPIVP